MYICSVKKVLASIPCIAFAEYACKHGIKKSKHQLNLIIDEANGLQNCLSIMVIPNKLIPRFYPQGFIPRFTFGFSTKVLTVLQKSQTSLISRSGRPTGIPINFLRHISASYFKEEQTWYRTCQKTTMYVNCRGARKSRRI
jgi:hypothetical protein